MKTRCFKNWKAVCLFAIGITTTAVAWATSDDRDLLSHLVMKLDKLHRVTKTPHPMADSTAQFCDLTFNGNIHEGVGDTAYCHVYVTHAGKDQMLSGNGKYPPGTVIVKSKLKSEKSKDAILYTVMRKMAEGFDTDHGDWEYSILDGPSKRVLASGKIDSCIACHREYSKSDYVTRAYMKENSLRAK